MIVTREFDFCLPEGWNNDALPTIDRIVMDQFAAVEPPFVQAWYGDRYRDFASDPLWLAHSFVANAEKEAEGSRKLYTIAASARRQPFAEEILIHAEDEARHARMYIGMLRILFPEALDDEERRALNNGFPIHEVEVDANLGTPDAELDYLVDQIVQMNIGEIRTRLHQKLLRPVALAYCSPKSLSRMASSLDQIYEDEGRHIIYTATILERLAKNGWKDRIEQLYRRRLVEFGEITLVEVGGGQFD